MLDLKIEAIRSHFNPILGEKIIRYETAEIGFEDGVWEPWPDPFIRLYFQSNRMVAISWSKLDDLWFAGSLSLPFSTAGSSFRWVTNGIEAINAVIGAARARRNVSWRGGIRDLDETLDREWRRMA